MISQNCTGGLRRNGPRRNGNGARNGPWPRNQNQNLNPSNRQLPGFPNGPNQQNGPLPPPIRPIPFQPLQQPLAANQTTQNGQPIIARP